VGNIIVALFAILLCLINAIVWTFVSDAQRYAQDANYRTGWTDGASLCKKR